jgi:predicted amidohydrolase YtcJ
MPSPRIARPDPSHSALAIVNARVYTRDIRRPWADAVLVRGERVEAVGSSAELRKWAREPVKVIDARGMTVAPASVDGVLCAGAPADLMIVESTLTKLTEDAIRDAPRLLELAAGRVVFDRDGVS